MVVRQKLAIFWLICINRVLEENVADFGMPEDRLLKRRQIVRISLRIAASISGLAGGRVFPAASLMDDTMLGQA